MEKIGYRYNWFLSIACTVVLALSAFPMHVVADSVNTSVTVGNSAPSFDVAPAESVNSSSTTPTNAGDSITFNATGTDGNGEDYYLAICKTNAITPSSSGAPTCGGGDWCISTATSSDTQASCSYTTLVGDAESNDWYAFVCDANSGGAACSTSATGSGDSGSPFKVNHRPTFDTVSVSGGTDPGSDVTWSTNVSTADADSDGTPDTVKLVICKTTGVSGGDCDGGAGDRWCQSSSVANNPSCSYTVPTPTVDQSYTAYAYLFDSHDFAATGVNQGGSVDYTVNNVSPVVSSVNVNGGADIVLTEGTSQTVTVTGTVTDNNSCNDLSTIEASLYRSAIGYVGCDTNAEDEDDNCYAQVSCTIDTGGDTCTGSTDASADYECDVSVWFNADPTDATTVYSAQDWKGTINAIDDNAASGNTESTGTVEMESLVGYSVTSSIAYGTLSVGQANDPLDKIVTTTATGNVGLDQELSGVDMDDGGINTIAIGQQKYALASSTPYASGTSMTTSPVEVEINIPKTTNYAAPSTGDTYLGLEIPPGTVSGSYSGTVTITAVKSEIGEW